MERYSYFDSVLDIASNSHAADEIRRLTNELVDLRLGITGSVEPLRKRRDET